MADQVRMPSGMGGLVRYSDEATSKFQIKPGTVIIYIIIIILIEIFLHTYGQNWLG